MRADCNPPARLVSVCFNYWWMVLIKLYRRTTKINKNIFLINSCLSAERNSPDWKSPFWPLCFCCGQGSTFLFHFTIRGSRFWTSSRTGIASEESSIWWVANDVVVGSCPDVIPVVARSVRHVEHTWRHIGAGVGSASPVNWTSINFKDGAIVLCEFASWGWHGDMVMLLELVVVW